MNNIHQGEIREATQNYDPGIRHTRWHLGEHYNRREHEDKSFSI
jgi:hypothetical protein